MKWPKGFLEGRELLEDDARPGKAHHFITPEMIAEVNALVLGNRSFTVNVIHRLLGTSVTTNHSINQHINFQKNLCAVGFPPPDR